MELKGQFKKDWNTIAEIREFYQGGCTWANNPKFAPQKELMTAIVSACELIQNNIVKLCSLKK